MRGREGICVTECIEAHADRHSDKASSCSNAVCGMQVQARSQKIPGRTCDERAKKLPSSVAQGRSLQVSQMCLLEQVVRLTHCLACLLAVLAPPCQAPFVLWRHRRHGMHRSQELHNPVPQLVACRHTRLLRLRTHSHTSRARILMPCNGNAMHATHEGMGCGLWDVGYRVQGVAGVWVFGGVGLRVWVVGWRESRVLQGLHRWAFGLGSMPLQELNGRRQPGERV